MGCTGPFGLNLGYERGLMMRARVVMILILVVLQIADVATTNYGLALPGRQEGNPVMAWAQGTLGDHWWLLKLGLAGLGIAALSRLRSSWPLQVVVGYYAAIVMANASHIPYQ